MKVNIGSLVLLATLAGSLLVAKGATAQAEEDATETAQEGAAEEQEEISESIVVLGSRSTEPRSSTLR